MRKNISFTVTVLLAGIIIALFFALHTSSWRINDDQPRTIYFADNISPAHRIVIDRFNKKHQGSIQVVTVDLPFDKFSTNERKELLARSLRNKSDRIDVFAVDLIWVPRFSKWSEPLGGHFDEQKLASIIENALDPCYVDSELVAMPLYLDIGMMYYRRDLLRRLPDWQEVERRLQESIAWDELLKLQARLTPAGNPFYIFAAKDYEGLVCNYLELMVGQMSSYSSNKALDLTTPEAGEALRMMIGFVQKDGVSPKQVTDFDENRSYDFMLAHDGLFCRGWPNFLENYATFYPDTAKLQSIGRAALPHFKGMRPRSVFGGWNLMVSKYSNHKKEALALIEFFQSEESQKTMFEVGGYLPTSKHVYQDTAYMNAHPHLVYYKKLLENGFHRPALDDYTRISDIISHYIHRALKGELTSEEALHLASREISSTNIAGE